MLRLLAKARSLFAFLLLILLWPGWGVVQRLIVWPIVRFTRHGTTAISMFMKAVSASIFFCVRLGGGRTVRRGRVPTDGPVLMVMNHQSLLDIPTAILMQSPQVGWFVTRELYGRGVPVISFCIELMRGPLIDPTNRKAALRALREVARTQRHGALIFPEGHRTRDGDVQPFQHAGLEIMLRERPMPVYLLITDGFWTCRRLPDFVFNMATIDGRTEVLGPFPPPAEGDLKGFVETLRQRMIEHLAAMRGSRDAAA